MDTSDSVRYTPTVESFPLLVLDKSLFTRTESFFVRVEESTGGSTTTSSDQEGTSLT